MPGRIAVLNTDVSLIELLMTVLAEGGLASRPYYLSAGTFQQLRAAQPPLIILDLGLGPAARGLPLLRHLQADAATCHIPVLSTSVDKEYLYVHAALLQTLCVAIPEVPTDLERLAGTVHSALPAQPMLLHGAHGGMDDASAAV